MSWLPGRHQLTWCAALLLQLLLLPSMQITSSAFMLAQARLALVNHVLPYWCSAWWLGFQPSLPAHLQLPRQARNGSCGCGQQEARSYTAFLQPSM